MDCVKGVHVGALCVARDLFRHAGGFDEGLRCWEVTDFLVRAALAAGRMVLSSRPVLSVHQTPDGQFESTRRVAAYLARIASNMLDQLPRVPALERPAYCAQVANFVYGVWEAGALTEYRKVARRAIHCPGWSGPRARFLTLASLPGPLLRGVWRARWMRQRFGSTRDSAGLDLLKASEFPAS